MARAAVDDLARIPRRSMPRSLPAPRTLAPCVISAWPPQLTHSPSPQALQERRARCETQNIDPVVWTNQRVLKWVRDIDLKVRGDGGGGRGGSWAYANPMPVCVQIQYPSLSVGWASFPTA